MMGLSLMVYLVWLTALSQLVVSVKKVGAVWAGASHNHQRHYQLPTEHYGTTNR